MRGESRRRTTGQRNCSASASGPRDRQPWESSRYPGGGKLFRRSQPWECPGGRPSDDDALNTRLICCLRPARFGARLCLANHLNCPKNTGRIDTDRIDPELGKVAGNFGIVRRRFAADANVPAITFGAEHGELEHFAESELQAQVRKLLSPWFLLSHSRVAHA